MKKVLTALMAAVMMLTVVACTAMASEQYSTETVKEVQQALNDAGFDCGTPDGVAGNNTKDAISEYQKEKGLPVTGEINSDLLISLFSAEEPEETEKTTEKAVEEIQETDKATEETEDAKFTTKVAVDEVGNSDDAMYTMDPEDAMYFTFDDGVKYKLHSDEDAIIYEQMEGEEETEIYKDPYIKEMTSFFVEKYFYSARAEEEGLEKRELPKVNLEDLFEADEYTNLNYFKWNEYACDLTFAFGGTDETYTMYYENDAVKVGKLSESGEIEEMLSFDSEEDKAETEYFVDISFILNRVFDDSEFGSKIP